MSTVSVCDGMGLGLAAEFWRSLEKGGFTVTDAKLVINSPDNAAARAMFAALQELGAGFEKDQLFGSSIYSVKVPVVKPEIDLRSFFSNRPGLWSSDTDFRQSLQEEPASFAELTRVSCLRLRGEITGYTAEQKIKSEQRFSRFEAASVVARLIHTQWGGVEGLLLNDPNKQNVFYLPNRLLFVRARPAAREWHFQLSSSGDDYQIKTGSQIFLRPS